MWPFNGAQGDTPTPNDMLVEAPADGHWTGFFPGITDGTKYRFWVIGDGDAGFNVTPWAP